MRKYNMICKKFGKLTVLEEYKERDKYGCKVYKCICDCGKIISVRGVLLRNNTVKSCGCLKHTGKHKKRDTRLYHIFSGIKQRCYNENNPSYKHYGGRGVVVCDEWLNNFMAFYEWSMNNGYNDTLTIDRIDYDGNYEPNNCRWVKWEVQTNNKRNNVLLTYNGKTQTMAQWARELNIPYVRINRRHQKNWSDKECLLGKEV